MNKRFRIDILAATISMVVMIGCGGSTIPVDEELPVKIDTNYLTDVYGVGIKGVRYYCDSNSSKVFTLANGDFNFNANGDKCKFMLTDDNVSNTAQPLYINSMENNDSSGINGLPYICTSGHSGKTGDSQANGYFDHVLEIDECTITYE